MGSHDFPDSTMKVRLRALSLATFSIATIHQKANQVEENNQLPIRDALIRTKAYIISVPNFKEAWLSLKLDEIEFKFHTQ